jgi:hypothetical protein
MRDEERIHFWEPEIIKEGDLVWFYEGVELMGPFVVIELDYIGYGSNKRRVYRIFDTSSGSWYTSEKKWLRTPLEIT